MAGDANSPIEELKTRALEELSAADSAELLEEWRVSYLGRRGELTQVLRGLSSRPPDERRTIGASANDAKTALEENLELRQRAVKDAEVNRQLAGDAVDVTLPGWPSPVPRPTGAQSG